MRDYVSTIACYNHEVWALVGDIVDLCGHDFTIS